MAQSVVGRTCKKHVFSPPELSRSCGAIPLQLRLRRQPGAILFRVCEEGRTPIPGSRRRSRRVLVRPKDPLGRLLQEDVVVPLVGAVGVVVISQLSESGGLRIRKMLFLLCSFCRWFVDIFFFLVLRICGGKTEPVFAPDFF